MRRRFKEEEVNFCESEALQRRGDVEARQRSGEARRRKQIISEEGKGGGVEARRRRIVEEAIQGG